MANHVYVLVLFSKDRGTRVEAVFTNRREAEARQNAINCNHALSQSVEGHEVDTFPDAPTAAIIKKPLHGENNAALKILKKIDIAHNQLSDSLYELTKLSRNRRKSRRRQMIDNMLGW